MKKISRTRLIEAIVNNEDCKPDKQLAIDLGITPEHFCRLKSKYSSEIKNASRRIIQKNAVTLVNYLLRNAKKGSDNAAKYLLDMEKSMDMEVAVKELQADISKIKQIQAERAEKEELGLIRTGTD